MERYKLQFVTAAGKDLTILVPFAPSSSVRELKDEAVRRLARAGVTVDPALAHLRLDSASGPLLDGEDVVANVVLYPAQETLILVENLHHGSGSAGKQQEVQPVHAN